MFCKRPCFVVSFHNIEVLTEINENSVWPYVKNTRAKLNWCICSIFRSSRPQLRKFKYWIFFWRSLRLQVWASEFNWLLLFCRKMSVYSYQSRLLNTFQFKILNVFLRITTMHPFFMDRAYLPQSYRAATGRHIAFNQQVSWTSEGWKAGPTMSPVVIIKYKYIISNTQRGMAFQNFILTDYLVNIYLQCSRHI